MCYAEQFMHASTHIFTDLPIQKFPCLPFFHIRAASDNPVFDLEIVNFPKQIFMFITSLFEIDKQTLRGRAKLHRIIVFKTILKR